MQVPGTQVAIATAIGSSEATVSRLKNEHLETFSMVLAHAGLKVVPQTHVCVDRESYEAMTLIASRAMADRDIAKKLIWEGD